VLSNFVVRQIDYTLAIALFAFGHEKLLAIRCLIDGAVSVILAAILAPHFGFEGIAAGFLCGGLLVAIPTDAVFVARDLQISILELFKPYLAYLWRSALVGAIGLAAKQWIAVPTLLNTAILAIGVASSYLLLALPYVWRTPLRGYIQTAGATIGASMRSRIPGWALKKAA